MESNCGRIKFSITEIVLLMLLSYSLFIPDATANKTIKILVLGDSITQAETNRASFRYHLWKKLIDANIDFDFVGSMNKQLGEGIPPHADYKGRTFDPDHEGHFAWTADEVIRGRAFDNGTGSGNLAGWLKSYDVDIALIHLGTNDAFMRQLNQSTINELKVIISLIREDNPNVTILLAQLIPTTYTAGDASAVESLNAAIALLPEKLATADSPVILVDQYTGFDGKADLYDMVHPNASGEEKMADRWYDAIHGVLKS